jgi:hypothetical protein
MKVVTHRDEHGKRIAAAIVASRAKALATPAGSIRLPMSMAAE